MPHESGNATWQDFPSTATLITALSLENVENLLDTLVSAVALPPGGLAYFRADLASDYSNAANTDIPAQTGWVEVADTHNAGVMSNTVGTPSTYTIPYGNRKWDILFDLYCNTQATNSAFSAKVTKNSTTIPAAATSTSASARVVATDFAETLSGTESHCKAHAFGVPLNQGDVLRWFSWASVTVNMRASVFGRPTQIIVRDAGPA